MTRHVYGRLTDAQRAALRQIVRGRIVHDLGAGMCALSIELATMGARRVVAIDAVPPPPRVLHMLPPTVTVRSRPFEQETDRPRVAVLSWPSLHLDFGRVGVMPLVKAASTVVYLGKNRDGIGCGGRPLFEHFAERQVLAYVPARRNNLLVLGRWRKGSEDRPLTPEEQDARTEFWS